jgi:hypothetical protein
MARNGKIARLPRAVRSQLNSRLQEGEQGKQIVQWLNSLPEVQAVLSESFSGHPVTEQNLSDWRQGGFEEWRVCQDLLAQAAELAAHRQEMEAVAPGQTPADLLAEAVAFRYGAILAGQGPELDEQALTQLNALGRVCRAVVQLRRSNQHAARQKIQTERWELEREQIREDKAEETQRKIRAALAARITSWMKVPEWQEKLGNTPEAARAAAILREMLTCPDPAHYHSDIIGNPEWDAWVEKLKRETPPKKTEMQAALDTYKEMEVGLGLRKSGKKARHAKPRPKAGRRAPHRPHALPHHPAARVPRRPQSAPRANKVHAIHDVHDVPEVPEAPPAPAPSPQPASAPDGASSLCPDSPHHSITLSADLSAVASAKAEPLQPPVESSPIVPNRT